MQRTLVEVALKKKSCSCNEVKDFAFNSYEYRYFDKEKRTLAAPSYLLFAILYYVAVNYIE